MDKIIEILQKVEQRLENIENRLENIEGALKKPEVKMPDISQEGWEYTKVGFQKTGDLTWHDLAQGKILPNGQNGRDYLERLSQWEAKPQIQKVAKAVLEKIKEEQMQILEDEVPF